MKTFVLAVLAVTPAFIAAAPAAAAQRNFSVTSFDRIRVDGPYKVQLAVGVAPFATASGSSQALDGLAIGVEGWTLVVHADRSGWGGYNGQSAGPIEISLGTHELSAAWVNGSGTLAIDQVKGLAFDLAVQGSGAASIERVTVDQLHVALAGAASARLGGAGLKMTAIVRGSSSLDATALSLKDVIIGAEGPAIVKVQASDTAKVNALGVAAVSLTGSPACVVKTQGSATVDGCR